MELACESPEFPVDSGIGLIAGGVLEAAIPKDTISPGNIDRQFPVEPFRRAARHSAGRDSVELRQAVRPYGGSGLGRSGGTP